MIRTTTLYAILSTFLVYAICLSPTQAQLKLIETDHLKLVSYDFGHEFILPHLTKSFHNSLEYHKNLFKYEPTEKVTMLLQDFGDYGNAGATAIPINFVTMGLSPFSYAFETSPAGERIFAMMNHELVHVVALDNAAKSDKTFQNLFLGKVNPTKANPISILYSYLTSPRMYAPRWYHEGIAAYVETWMDGGTGLAMGSYDEMVFRTMVLENAHIYSAQGLESEGVTTDFQGRSNSYLYGTRFMGYLAHEFSPDKIIEWVGRDENSKSFFAKQFKQVFGLSISKAWSNWIEFEKQWQQSNIEALSDSPITTTERFSQADFGSVSYQHIDKKRNKIYVAVNYPGQYPHIASIDLTTGKTNRLVDIKGPALFYVTSLEYDSANDALFYTTDNNAWRDLNRYDLKTGKTELLQENSRTGDLALHPVTNDLWGIKHLNGFSTIVTMPKGEDQSKEYSDWKQIYTLPYGHDIFDLDISPDGNKLSAAVSDLDGNQSLFLYDIPKLEAEEVVIDTIFNFEVSSPQSFRFTDDGQYMFGSSYYSGVSNIYRVEVATGKINIMSNVVTGLFRPLQIDEDKLTAFEFSSKGFLPVYLNNETTTDVSSIDFLGNSTIEKHPMLNDWELPINSTQEVNLNAYNYTESEYHPGKLQQVNYGYPIVVGYKDLVGIGYKLNISDPLNLRSFDVEASFTPKGWINKLNGTDSLFSEIDNSEQFHFSFNGRISNFHFSSSYNEASFYDLFGPRIRSRKGLAVGVAYEKSLIWDLPRSLNLNFDLDGFFGLDRSPEFQQIMSTGFDDSFFLRLSSSISFSHLKRSLGGVESEKGLSTSFGLFVTQSDGSYFTSSTATFDYGFSLPMKHSSIWLRSAAGVSFNDDINPFTRFGFASYGNNYVDANAYRQYRSAYSFPGLAYDNDFSIISKDYLKLTGEWVLPPWRYRKFGTFNFFANWTQPALFFSILYTRDPLLGNQQFANLGFQLDTQLVMLSHLSSTLSIGYARAWELDGDNEFGEWMISLKILK